jgi:hypothetical protein
MIFIGKLRGWLLLNRSCRWNAWVREFTAKLDGTWLVRSQR